MPMMYYSCRGGDRKILSDDFIPVGKAKRKKIHLISKQKNNLFLDYFKKYYFLINYFKIMFFNK
jgi:hypothetical protein